MSHVASVGALVAHLQISKPCITLVSCGCEGTPTFVPTK